MAETDTDANATFFYLFQFLKYTKLSMNLCISKAIKHKPNHAQTIRTKNIVSTRYSRFFRICMSHMYWKLKSMNYKQLAVYDIVPCFSRKKLMAIMLKEISLHLMGKNVVIYLIVE